MDFFSKIGAYFEDYSIIPSDARGTVYKSSLTSAGIVAKSKRSYAMTSIGLANAYSVEVCTKGKTHVAITKVVVHVVEWLNEERRKGIERNIAETWISNN